ncbi:sugar phosphate isomerase/epimerase family protein [Zavarzinella formosa]|uniref:sugar phosphate isomerase/epimerase family protein n=1 Tax=Zavarzinella formosa TaxID=360055 RepID=UPI0002F2838C|nr:sugar phosphate isomerase/epimerase [Zavarzinella formosa]
MTRREFSSSFLAAALLANRSLADAKPGLSLGFSLYGMKTLPVAEAIAACAKFKYGSVELACMPGWHGDPEKLTKEARSDLAKTLRDANLTAACLMESTPLDADDKKHRENLDRLKRAAELAHDLGMPTPQIETVLGGKPGEWETRKNQFAERLAGWGKLAESAKVGILIKPHRMQATTDPAHVVWLLEQANSKHLGSVFDWSHFEQRDYKLTDTLKLLLPSIRFIHVKDTIIEKEKAMFVLPGKGSTDYLAYFKLLNEAKFTGSVCVEVSAQVFNEKGYDPVAAARECAEKLLPAINT